MKRQYYKLREKLFMNSMMHAFPRLLKPFILCYHQIDEDEFDSHLVELKQRFEVLDLQAFQQRFTEGKLGGYCAITLDDCLEKDVAKAITVCKRHRIPMTFFLPVWFAMHKLALPGTKVQRVLEEKKEIRLQGKALSIDGQNGQSVKKIVNAYFNPVKLRIDEFDRRVADWFDENGFVEDEIVRDSERVLSIDRARQICSDPLFTFQSHTFSHETLALCSREEIEFEFSESRRVLKEQTLKDVFAICYPYGSKEVIGNEIFDIVSRYYTCGLTLIQGVCTAKSDIFFLPRIGIYPGDDLSAFWGKVYHYTQVSSFQTRK